MQLAGAAPDVPAAIRRRAGALLVELGACILALASSDAAGDAGAGKYLHDAATDAGADVDAFEAFFRAHEHALFGFLWRMTGDEQAAGDLTQETFLRAWQQFGKIRDYDRPDAWLFRIATHLALNHLRFRAVVARVVTTLFADATGATSTSGDPARSIAEQDAVRSMMLRLSPRERAALVLHSVVGLSCAELAETLGISLSAAKVTLYRAREHFRAAYSREEADDAD